MLKLRHRRGHDLRRTMISLARTDGARKEILELCTHTPRKGSAIDLYTTFPWEALCEEVSKLKVQRRSDYGDVVPLRALASGTADAAPTENRALATAASYRLPTADRKSLDPKSKTGGGAGSRLRRRRHPQMDAKSRPPLLIPPLNGARARLATPRDASACVHNVSRVPRAIADDSSAFDAC